MYKSDKTFDLTISVVNYNAGNLLKQCIDSIIKNTKRISYEIIVVDNASKDGSIEIIREKFPQVTLIINKENRGFAAANNQAIKVAKGEYIVLLNPDIIVCPEALDKMVEFMKTHKDVGAAGAKLLNPYGSIQDRGYYRKLPSIMQILLFYTFLVKFTKLSSYLRRKFLEIAEYNQSQQVEQVPGSCLMVRKRVVQEIGFMDENFHIWFEDVDWCYRIKKKWKLYYYPNAEMIHYGGHSFRSLDERTKRAQFRESMLKYFAKHYKNKLIAIRLILYLNAIVSKVLLFLKDLIERKRTQ